MWRHGASLRSYYIVRLTRSSRQLVEGQSLIDSRLSFAPDQRQPAIDHPACVKLSLRKNNASIMLFSKEYVGYLAREVSKKLVASGLIETKAMPALNEKVHAAMLEELALEDRINDEVRVILEAYSEEMQKSGANYQEMFRKVKTELAKKYKAVL
jgi:hypothetical protein